MLWEEPDHDNDFRQVQEQVAAYIKKQREPVTTTQIRHAVGDRFLGDALQVLESTGRISASGGVLLPKYSYCRDEVQPEKLRACYHCGNVRKINDYYSKKTQQYEKICSSCQKHRERKNRKR